MWESLAGQNHNKECAVCPEPEPADWALATSGHKVKGDTKAILQGGPSMILPALLIEFRCSFHAPAAAGAPGACQHPEHRAGDRSE